MKQCFMQWSGSLLLVLLNLYGQDAVSQSTPFEGANVIIVSTDLADKEAYLTIGRTLTDQGIVFTAGSDCLTFPLPVAQEGSRATNLIGQVSVNAGLVKLTGVAHSPTFPEGNQQAGLSTLAIGYTRDKRKNSIPETGFLYLNEVAKKLSRPLHGVISYKQQHQTDVHTASY